MALFVDELGKVETRNTSARLLKPDVCFANSASNPKRVLFAPFRPRMDWPVGPPENHRGKAAEEPAAGRLVRSERRIRRRQRAPHMCDRASVEAEPLFGLLEVAAYDVRELLV